MAPAVTTTVIDDLLDVAELERAWHGADPGNHPAATSVNGAQLTITRNSGADFQGRQVFLFVDEEPWGKVKYGDAVPGDHVRLKCTNGMPTAGWLMMIFLHVTALCVRLEPET